jgi:hypothetical protein
MISKSVSPSHNSNLSQLPLMTWNLSIINQSSSYHTKICICSGRFGGGRGEESSLQTIMFIKGPNIAEKYNYLKISGSPTEMCIKEIEIWCKWKVDGICTIQVESSRYCDDVENNSLNSLIFFTHRVNFSMTGMQAECFSENHLCAEYLCCISFIFEYWCCIYISSNIFSYPCTFRSDDGPPYQCPGLDTMWPV